MASSRDAASCRAAASASDGATRAVAASQHETGAAVRSAACAAMLARSSSVATSDSDGAATPRASAYRSIQVRTSGPTAGECYRPGSPVRSPGVPLEAKVLTVSDSVHAGAAEDRSGAALAERLAAAGFLVVERAVVADGVVPVADALRRLCQRLRRSRGHDRRHGFAPRTSPPRRPSRSSSARRPVWPRPCAPPDRTGRLSRGTAGTVGRVLVAQHPGIPRRRRGVPESLVDVLPHALELLAGGTPTPTG